MADVRLDRPNKATYTGLRVGEAVGLTWKDVSFTTKHLYVR
ncbi:MAG TPA: hypothetical protein V6D14_23175 [Coleofasciculaceae cyanobacterium]